MSGRKALFMSAEDRQGSWDLTMMMRRSQAESRFTEVRLFFPDDKPHGRARKTEGLTDLVLKKAKVRSGDILRVADEERKDRRVDRDLGHERGGRDLRRFPFTGRQGMNGENLLQELIELACRDAG